MCSGKIVTRVRHECILKTITGNVMILHNATQDTSMQMDIYHDCLKKDG